MRHRRQSCRSPSCCGCIEIVCVCRYGTVNLRLSFTPESQPEEAVAPTEPQKTAKAPEVEEGVPPIAAATGPEEMPASPGRRPSPRT